MTGEELKQIRLTSLLSCSPLCHMACAGVSRHSRRWRDLKALPMPARHMKLSFVQGKLEPILVTNNVKDYPMSDT